jgi:opacity protein-like surface antigen
MTKISLASTVAALVFASAATASADPARSSCAPGSWICSDPPQDSAASGDRGSQGLQPLPDPDEAAPADDEAPAPRRRHAAPPVVVYQPPPPPPVVVVRPAGPRPYEYAPPPSSPISRPREWGLNLHVDGAAFGHGAGNAGMGGAGAGLRFKPSRRFGIETDLDILGGTDYQNDRRTETAFTINGLVYLNPRSRAQLYLLIGFGWSGAHVTCDSAACSGPADRHYTYFGGQAGGGLEIRLSRAIALNADVRGFIRTRIDDQAQSQPEFTDQYGRTSNSSGGALFTGGMTIYF